MTTRIPSAQQPVIDPRTGLMAREWYRFFAALGPIAFGTWNTTLTDGSGHLASPIVVNSAEFLTVGKFTLLVANITYPPTADTHASGLVGLPVTPTQASDGSANGNSHSSNILCGTSAPFLSFYDSTGTQATNADLSGLTITFAIWVYTG